MMGMYKVEFLINDLGNSNTRRFKTYVPCISVIQDGFWVDDNGSYTTSSDCKYFILPHMVKHVEKQLKEKAP